MTKIQMIQTRGVPGIAVLMLFLSLEPLLFEFVSNFEIRISDFTKPGIFTSISCRISEMLNRRDRYAAGVMVRGFAYP